MRGNYPIWYSSTTFFSDLFVVRFLGSVVARSALSYIGPDDNSIPLWATTPRGRSCCARGLRGRRLRPPRALPFPARRVLSARTLARHPPCASPAALLPLLPTPPARCTLRLLSRLSPLYPSYSPSPSAPPSSLTTGWKCNLLLPELHLVATSQRATRSNWPSDCDLLSATLSLLAVCSLGERVIPSRWAVDGYLLQITTHYRLAGAATRPGARCMRLFRHVCTTWTPSFSISGSSRAN